jgi:PRC-barrel domain
MEYNMDYIVRDTYGIYKKHRHTGIAPTLLGAATLIGTHVVNKHNEDIGSVTEIMLDVASGGISYVVLSCGSFLGMGEKFFAVPWGALTLNQEQKRFTLDVEKHRLQEAPAFTKDEWPNMADQTWSEKIHAYYSTLDTDYKTRHTNYNTRPENTPGPV